MQCEDFELRWQDLLDERRAPDEDPSLRAHAEGCTLCRRLLTGQDALFSGLDVFEAPSLSKDFASRVVAQFRHSDEPVLAERAIVGGASSDAPTPVQYGFGWLAAITLVAAAALFGIYLANA